MLIDTMWSYINDLGLVGVLLAFAGGAIVLSIVGKIFKFALFIGMLVLSYFVFLA